ncbi:MAG: hypothetical protein H6Q66_281 [Firmicutes bacterium]|nr:hypothetical protein [Bacillota bacterium]
MQKVFSMFRIIVAVIIGSILLCVFTIPVVYRVVNYTEIEQREQNLHSEFQAIVHPEGAKQLKYKMNSKIVMRWIDAEYTYTNMNDLEVERYYNAEMIRKGWIKQTVSEERYKHFHESIYRKEDYEMVFSPHKDSVGIYLNYKDIFDRLGL